MDWTKYKVVVAWVLVVALLGSSLLAGDWPQWRGPNRDGKVAGFEAPPTWPDQLKLQWKVEVGPGDATPALVGDRLYCFSRQQDQEVLWCLSASDGKVIWKEGYEAVQVQGPASRHPGPRSSPAVSEGKVVTLGVGGILSCWDAQTGKLVWQKDVFPNLTPRFYTATSPIILEGMAITHLGGQGNGAVIAFDLASGQEKWRWAKEGPSYSSPVPVTVDGVAQVIVMTEASVVGLAVKDGAQLWQVPFQPQGRAYNAATPVVDGQTVILAGAGRGTKAVKIARNGERFEANQLWSCDMAPQFCSQVLKGGLLFGLSDQGRLYCINAKDGSVAWVDQENRRNFGAMLDLGPCLALLPESGQLTLFKPAQGGFEQIAQYQVSEGSAYAHPVVAGNRVYVKDTEGLALWSF